MRVSQDVAARKLENKDFIDILFMFLCLCIITCDNSFSSSLELKNDTLIKVNLLRSLGKLGMQSLFFVEVNDWLCIFIFVCRKNIIKHQSWSHWIYN